MAGIPFEDVARPEYSSSTLLVFLVTNIGLIANERQTFARGASDKLPSLKGAVEKCAI